MKKRFLLALLLTLALLLGITACAHAEARIDYVTDEAGILTANEVKALRDSAAAVSDKYDCGVYLVVVYDHTKYVNGNIETFAETVFDSYDLGYGESKNGVLLAMSMKERDYDIYAHGSFGNAAFTDYGKTKLAESFLDNFRRNDWIGGFRDYISTSDSMLRQARDGKPVDVWIPDPAPAQPRFSFGKLLASIGLGCLFGGAVVGGMKRSMKTAVRQVRAENYLVGGVSLHTRTDQFVNRVVNRHVIPRTPPSSGGRPGGGHFGGTTISGSHGGSHHSGKF